MLRDVAGKGIAVVVDRGDQEILDDHPCELGGRREARCRRGTRERVGLFIRELDLHGLHRHSSIRHVIGAGRFDNVKLDRGAANQNHLSNICGKGRPAPTTRRYP
jgi:hypothetical protein